MADSPNPETASPVAPPGITLELDVEPGTPPDKGSPRPATSAHNMSGTPQHKDSPDRYAARSTERERRRLVGDIGSVRSRRAPSPSSVLPGRRRRNFSRSLSGRLSSVERVRSNEGDGDAKDVYPMRRSFSEKLDSVSFEMASTIDTPRPPTRSTRRKKSKSGKSFSSKMLDEQAAGIVGAWRGARHEDHFCCDAPGLMIHPNTPFCQVKDIAFIFLVLYSATYEPYKAAFLIQFVTVADTLDIIVDVCFWVDIVLNFFTGYEKTAGVELDKRNVAVHYLKGWFIIDLAATFPWDVLVTPTEETENSLRQLSLLRLLRLIRVLRILRLGRIVERLSSFMRIRAAFIKIAQLVFQLGMVTHMLACFFFLMSSLFSEDPSLPDGPYLARIRPGDANETLVDDAFLRANPCFIDDDRPEIKGEMANSWVCDNGLGPESGEAALTRYITSMYWAITTISTIGYGDISPSLDSNAELLFTTITEFLGMFIFSYTVSNMAALVGRLNVKTRDFNEQLDRALEYMRDKNIDVELQDRVLDYLQYVHASKLAQTQEDDNMMALLSESLQMELTQATYLPVLERISLFEGQDEFVEQFAMCMQIVTVMPGDLILARGDKGSDEMYVILHGTVKVFGNSVARAHEIQERDLYPFFGVAEMMARTEKDRLEHRSVVATTTCDLAQISKEDFDEVLVPWPSIKAEFQAVAQAELADVQQLDEQGIPKREVLDRFKARLEHQRQLYAEPTNPAEAGSGMEAAKAAAEWERNQSLCEDGRLSDQEIGFLVHELGAELSAPQLVSAMVLMDKKKKGGAKWEDFWEWWTSNTAEHGLFAGFESIVDTEHASGRTSLMHTSEALHRGRHRDKDHHGTHHGISADAASSADVKKLSDAVDHVSESVTEMDERVTGLDHKLGILQSSSDAMLTELRMIRKGMVRAENPAVRSDSTRSDIVTATEQGASPENGGPTLGISALGDSLALEPSALGGPRSARPTGEKHLVAERKTHSSEPSEGSSRSHPSDKKGSSRSRSPSSADAQLTPASQPSPLPKTRSARSRQGQTVSSAPPGLRGSRSRERSDPRRERQGSSTTDGATSSEPEPQASLSSPGRGLTGRLAQHGSPESLRPTPAATPGEDDGDGSSGSGGEIVPLVSHGSAEQ